MNENIVLRDKPALVPILILWPLAAITFGLALLILSAVFPLPVIQLAYAIVALIFIAACVLRLLVDLVDRETTLYTLTDRHVAKEWGILHRDQKIIPLENVQVVTIRQPLLGRLLDYGTVVVQAAGLGGIRISMVAKPHEWQKAILQSAPAGPGSRSNAGH